MVFLSKLTKVLRWGMRRTSTRKVRLAFVMVLLPFSTGKGYFTMELVYFPKSCAGMPLRENVNKFYLQKDVVARMEHHHVFTLRQESIDNSSHKICFSSTQSVSITTIVINDIIGLITLQYHLIGLPNHPFYHYYTISTGH